VETYFERIKERLNLQNFNQLLREAALWAHSLQGPYSGADGGQDDASV
jgi:hypothetical protein